MIINEVQRDLFSVPHGYMLAHCISADFALGAGIAKQFEERYGMRKMLKLQYGDVDWWNLWGPTCLCCSNVLNLVTKEHYYNKPTLLTLCTALTDMKRLCTERGFSKIAMPHIGCGLDRLNWDDVRALIQKVFSDTNIEFLVCTRGTE